MLKIMVSVLTIKWNSSLDVTEMHQSLAEVIIVTNAFNNLCYCKYYFFPAKSKQAEVQRPPTGEGPKPPSPAFLEEVLFLFYPHKG